MPSIYEYLAKQGLRKLITTEEKIDAAQNRFLTNLEVDVEILMELLGVKPKLANSAISTGRKKFILGLPNNAITETYTCNTVASNETKVLNEEFSSATLIDNKRIRVVFFNGNTYRTPLLKTQLPTQPKVNAIEQITGDDCVWPENYVVELRYTTANGGAWIIENKYQYIDNIIEAILTNLYNIENIYKLLGKAMESIGPIDQQFIEDKLRNPDNIIVALGIASIINPKVKEIWKNSTDNLAAYDLKLIKRITDIILGIIPNEMVKVIKEHFLEILKENGGLIADEDGKIYANYANLSGGSANRPIYINNGIPTLCTSLDTSIIPGLNANKIVEGTIDIERLPAGALERLITVSNQEARYSLTTSDVQLGDTVRQADTGILYYVVNTSELNNSSGYIEYTAGSATSVPWSGITNKPSTFTPSIHTHTITDISNLDLLLRENGGLALYNNKLYVDFSAINPEIMKSIVLGMTVTGGGLVADTVTGKLYFDPSQMDLTKFETLINAIHIPLWVGEKVGGVTIGTNFYVNNAKENITEAEYNRHNKGGYAIIKNGNKLWFEYREENDSTYTYYNLIDNSRSEDGINISDAEYTRHQSGGSIDKEAFYVKNVSGSLKIFNYRDRINATQYDYLLNDANNNWFITSELVNGNTRYYRYGNLDISMILSATPSNLDDDFTEEGIYYKYWWYVGKNTNTIEPDGIRFGRSAEHPWRTIAYAAEVLCKDFNINSKSITINVAAGTYSEHIDLALQQRTTGRIIISPMSNDGILDTVNITMPLNEAGNVIDHSGGLWQLNNLNITLIINPQIVQSGSEYISILRSGDSTGGLHVKHCNLSYIDNSITRVSGVFAGYIGRLINVNNGYIRFLNDVINTDGEANIAAYTSTWSGSKNANSGLTVAQWLFITTNGALELQNSTTSGLIGFIYNVSGYFSKFCVVQNKGMLNTTGQGKYPSFTSSSLDSNSIKFEINTGGTVIVPKISGVSNNGEAMGNAFFPGVVDGTIMPNTYSLISIED